MRFKLFSFDWFRSDERKQLEKLQLKEQELKNDILEYKLDESIKQGQKPYKKLIYTNGSITAVLHDGIVITKKKCDRFLFELVKDARDESIVRSLLLPDPEHKIEFQEIYTEEEVQLVKDNLGILRTHPDFEIVGESVYLKGVKLALVPGVLASFIELTEKLNGGYLKPYPDMGLEEKYEALKNFWRWTALNPIESSRNDLYSFIKNNNVAITNNGLLELYRRVNKKGKGNKALVEFVSEQYARIKRNKKAPKNYLVWGEDDGNFSLSGVDVKSDGISHLEGNLEELYLNLPTMEENVYTDAHTGKMVIRIGEVYKESEDKIDLDNTRDCSSGLHVGSKSFGFDGFGDTGVIALVNPMKVRSVPVSATNKMRVSEMFIAAVMPLEAYGEHVDSGEINDYSEEYYNIALEEIEEQLKNKSYETLSCQENVPALAIVDIKDIATQLRNRVVSIN